MKKFRAGSFLLLSLFFYSTLAAQPCNLAGVYKIGPTGTYPTLTAAITALRATGVGNHVILELQTTYTSTGETFPLTFSNIPCVDASRTITVRPETGATNRTITATTSTAIDLSNARYIHFDGRPGGSGTSRQLTIINNFNAVVRFMNDASFNSFSYVNIQGGGIYFNTSNQSTTNGNNNNTIQECAIYGGISGGPGTVIYSQGSDGKKNTNNKISNNLIYNHQGPAAIQLEKNTGPWEILGNHIYNNGSGTGGVVIGISINDSTSAGFQVHNNFIGGSAPGCGGSPRIYNSFIGINVFAGSSTYNSIQGNTISNVHLTANWQGSYFAGISMLLGKFKCGDQTGNIIGSQTQNGNITIRGEDDFNAFGIVAGTGSPEDSGVDTCFIMNNRIGGFYGYQADFNFSQTNTIAGIYMRGQKKGYADISNNSIGSPDKYFSMLNVIGFSETRTYGISCDKYWSHPSPENKISNNLVANLAGSAKGIIVREGKPKILNNTIRNLYGNEDLDFEGSPMGIMLLQTGTGTLVSGNTIHSLTWIGQGFDVIGIYTTMTEGIIVEKNFIHSFQASLPSHTANQLIGMYFYDCRKQTIRNNMIRLGIDTAGNTTVYNTIVKGIQTKLDSTTITNNSIYIGGTGTFESAALHLFQSVSPSKVRNNILVNNRTISATTFYNHYALKYDGGDFGTHEFNHNIYHTTGSQGYLAFLTIIPYQPLSNNFTNIIDWRYASKQDSNSIFYNPNFVNPTGTAANVNLHLANPNPAEAQGIADPYVTDDIDNEQRSSLSPTDIGADAGNFSLQDGDAPRITHKAFLGNPVPTNFIYYVKITDNGAGVDTSGNKKPRMWFRKKFPTIGPWASLPGNLVSGNLKNGLWGFIPDFAAAGVPVTIGDSLEYYFVAQDKGPIANTGYSNVPGTVHANVNTQTSPPANPLRLLIYGIFPDTVYVGSGQTFTSLTNDGGFFQAAKAHMFDTTSASPTVIITSDLSETGTHFYTNINETGARIRFTTNTPVIKQVKHQGNINYALITFANVRNVTLDGSVNGSGRYLHFINGHFNPTYTGPALYVIGGGNGLVVKNSIFETNGTTNYGESMAIHSNQLDTLTIENNLFKNIESSSTATVGLPNSGLFININKSNKIYIRKNEFTNFGQAGLSVRQSTLTPTGEIYIDSNHFYYNSAIQPVNGRTAIDVQVNVKSFITNNFVGGSQPFCGGNPWTYTQQTTASNQFFKGILVSGPTYIPSSVQNNTIQNIRILNFGVGFIGIHAAGGTMHIGTEQPNLIGSMTGDSSIVCRDWSRGIYGYIAIYSIDTPLVRVENNIIAGISAGYNEGIYIETRRGKFNNNIIHNLTSAENVSFPGFIGMKIWVEKGEIVGNRITQLIAKQQTVMLGRAYGMDLAMTGPLPNEVLVARNKVAGLRSDWTGTTGAQTLVGMRMQFGQFDLQNNQVDLNNHSQTNYVDLKGILIEGQTGSVFRSKLYYNTVRIAGSTTYNVNSHAVLITGGSPLGAFRNNILYNERTGGTGKHLALGEVANPSPPIWFPGTGNNNLYIVTDTNFVNEYRTTGAVNIRQWRNLSSGDSASFAAMVSDVPSDSLFESTAIHDLNIKTTSTKSWYVNGKGLPIEGLSADYDSPAPVRSTSISNGATDIGADEFNTNTAPPVLIVSGNRAHGSTEAFIVNNRVVATITWGNTGILPTLGEPRLYSGVWPNDTTNNGTAHFARFMNSFWSIPATGGSNYSYSLTLHYDSSMLGKVTNASTMVINKRQEGVNGTWQVIQPTTVNTALRTITINNQTSFSEFTATDADATLQSGVPAPDLVIINASVNTSTPGTGNPITASFVEYNQGTASSGTNTIRFYLSPDNNLTPASNGDTLLGDHQVTSTLNINSGTGNIDKVLSIPCNLAAGNYHLFIVADAGGTVPELEENNNADTVALNITIGITTPTAPAITATPSATVCSPGTITLSADPAGCTGCTYNWSTGSSGNSVVVSSSGTYMVTATNSCGVANSSQAVSILPVVIPAVSIDYTGCPSNTLNFTATAVNGGNAPTYQWLVNNVAAGTGASFTLNNAVNNTQVSVVLTSNAACPSPATASSTVSVNCITTAVPNIDGLESYSIGPNPGTGVYNLKMKFNQSKKVSARITDQLGRVVYEITPYNVSGISSKLIDLSHLQSGIYYLQVIVGKQSFTDKLIKTN